MLFMSMARSRSARHKPIVIASAAGLSACFSFYLYCWARLTFDRSGSPVVPAYLALLAAGAAGLGWLARTLLGRHRLAYAHRQRHQARVARQRALLQNTIDNIGEGLSVFDSRGRLVALNSRFCELLNLPPDLPVGTPLSEILLRQAKRGDFGNVDAREETARRLSEFFREVPLVKERVTLAGRTLQIRRTAMPDGAVLSVYSDITEIRAAERRLLEARRQAEAANHSKSEFLAK